MSSPEPEETQHPDSEDELAGFDFNEEFHEVQSKSKYSTFTSLCQQTYLEKCEELGCVPVTFYLKRSHEDVFRMAHHGLGPLGMEALAASLRVNTAINTLHISDNSIGCGGAQALSEALSMTNCQITDLDISGNVIASDGAIAIASMIETNRSLVRLNLSKNKFTEKDIALIAASLAQNPSLRFLNLSGNNCGDAGGKALGEMIAKNFTLEELDLSRSSLRLQGAKAVIQGLRVNQNLKVVNMSNNGLATSPTTGTKETLGDLLCDNSVLSSLNLAGNRLNYENALSLAKGLKQNYALQTLILDNNPLGSHKGVAAICDSLNKASSSALDHLSLKSVKAVYSQLKFPAQVQLEV